MLTYFFKEKLIMLEKFAVIGAGDGVDAINLAVYNYTTMLRWIIVFLGNGEIKCF
jgi:hypothetical protein